MTGEARLCITENEDPKKHKQDIVNAVVPGAVLNRKQHKKEKTCMRWDTSSSSSVRMRNRLQWQV